MGKWEIVRLGDICDILNGYAFKSEKYTNAGIRVIRITNVQKGFVEDNDPKYYPIKYINEIERYKLFENDLLISLTGNVGRVGLIKKEFLPAALNQRVGCLRIKNSSVVDKNYLFNILNSDFFENECIHNSKGMAQKNMSTEWLKEFILALPPLQVQHQIAETLDAASELLAMRKNQLAELDKLVWSVFYDVFGDPVTNEKGWDIKPISSFATVRIGPFGSLLHVEDYIEDGIPLINPSHIIDGKVVTDKKFTISEDKFNELQSYAMQKGDVVVGRRGEIGRCAVVENDGLLCGTGSMFIHIENDYIPMVLQKIISSNTMKANLLQQSVGVTMQNLNSGTISKLKVPIIPINQQSKFAETVQKIEEQKALVQKAIDETQALFDSLINEYFE